MKLFLSGHFISNDLMRILRDENYEGFGAFCTIIANRYLNILESMIF